MALDFSLIPNIKYLDPKFLKPSYDPTGQYHVIKDYGITMFFYNNKIVTEQPKTLKDFYDLLNKYVSKGRTNILDGPEEVVPLALMALGLDPNTSDQNELDQVRDFLLSDPQGRHDHQLVRLHQRRDRRQDHPRAGLERRRAQDRPGAQEPRATSPRSSPKRRRRSGRTTGASRPTHLTRWRRTHWIDWLLTPSTAVAEMDYHNYPIPIPDALAQLPADLRDDPLFNVPSQYTDNYKYVLNVSPAGRAGAHQDLHAVQGRLMNQADAKTGPAPAAPIGAAGPVVQAALPGVAASCPPFVYYVIFFLGAMAILVAFSLATQTGFGQISYGVQLRPVQGRAGPALPGHLRADDGDGVPGHGAHHRRRVSRRLLDGEVPHARTRCSRCS